MLRSVSSLLGLVVLVLGSSGLALAQNLATFEQRLTELDNEYSAKLKAIRQQATANRDPIELKRLAAEQFTLKETWPGRVLDLAQSDPTSKLVPKALNMVIVVGHRSPAAVAAIEQLRRDWLLQPEVSFVTFQLRASKLPQAEMLLRDILAQNPDRSTRGLACYSLAVLLETFTRVPTLIAGDDRIARRMEADYGPDQLEAIKRRPAEALRTETEDLFERVVREFADVKMYVAYPSDKTIGPSAQEWLAQHRELAVGKPALEIEGKDLNGQPLKLSDSRGKVVVLDFWGSWCAPCLAMLPHERELVKRLAGKPFAFLGINSDRTEAAGLASVAKEQMTWPSWYDGYNKEGGIADRYHVHSFPSVFVLDGNGIIRAKDVRGSKLDEAVDKLLAEMGK